MSALRHVALNRWQCLCWLRCMPESSTLMWVRWATRFQLLNIILTGLFLFKYPRRIISFMTTLLKALRHPALGNLKLWRKLTGPLWCLHLVEERLSDKNQEEDEQGESVLVFSDSIHYGRVFPYTWSRGQSWRIRAKWIHCGALWEIRRTKISCVDAPARGTAKTVRWGGHKLQQGTAKSGWIYVQHLVHFRQEPPQPLRQ